MLQPPTIGIAAQEKQQFTEFGVQTVIHREFRGRERGEDMEEHREIGKREIGRRGEGTGNTNTKANERKRINIRGRGSGGGRGRGILIRLHPCGDVLDSIMSPAGAVVLHLHSAQGKVHVVINNHKVTEGRANKCMKFADCTTTIIHIGVWITKDYILIRSISIVLMSVAAASLNVGNGNRLGVEHGNMVVMKKRNSLVVDQLLDQVTAHVVTSRSQTKAFIAKTNAQIN
jgi:hypothetical protein